MTTDTFPKMEVRTGTADGKEYTHCRGCQRGRHDHAQHGHHALLPGHRRRRGSRMAQAVFREAVDGSFNAITVDGDTSTNDTALIMANGLAGNSAQRRTLQAGFSSGSC